MTFTPKDWRDQPDHTTPITAAALEDLEQRLGDYSDTQPGAPGPAGPPGVGANWLGVWSSGTTYALGDGVTGSDGHNYISLQNTNLNHNPTTPSPTWWSPIGATYAGYGSTFVNVKDAPYGAVGDGTTDDTAAIQAAIDAVLLAGGGTVYFPAAVYAIKGALRSTATYGGGGQGYRAQITIGTPSTGEAPLVLLGPTPMNTVISGGSTGSPPTGGVILLSNNAGEDWSAHSALPSVIGGCELGGAVDAMVLVKNLSVATPANPKLACLNFQAVRRASIEGVLCWTDDYETVPSIEPTHPTGIGLVMPGLNTYGLEHINGYASRGQYTGLVVGEHTSGSDICVTFGHIGIGWQNGMATHGSQLGYCDVAENNYSIAYNDWSGATTGPGGPANSPSTAILNIDYLDLEDESSFGAWCAATAHISDLNQSLFGRIRYSLRRNSSNGQPVILNSGGNTQVHLSDLVDPRAWRSTRAILFGDSSDAASDQSIADNTATTLKWISGNLVGIGIVFTYDGLSAFTDTSHRDRLYPRVGGIYHADVYVYFAASGAGSYRQVWLRRVGFVGGAGSEILMTCTEPPLPAFGRAVTFSTTFYMDPADYLEVLVQHDAGSPLAVKHAGNNLTYIALTRVD